MQKSKPPHLCRADTTNNISASLLRYFRRKRLAVFKELGLCRGGRLRADLFAYSFKGVAVLIEIKSSVADFAADTKYTEYLNYCNKAYIASTLEVLRVIESRVDPRFGLMLPDGSVYRKAKTQTLELSIHKDLRTRMIFRNADSCTRKNSTMRLTCT